MKVGIIGTGWIAEKAKKCRFIRLSQQKSLNLPL